MHSQQQQQPFSVREILIPLRVVSCLYFPTMSQRREVNPHQFEGTALQPLVQIPHLPVPLRINPEPVPGGGNLIADAAGMIGNIASMPFTAQLATAVLDMFQRGIDDQIAADKSNNEQLKATIAVLDQKLRDAMADKTVLDEEKTRLETSITQNENSITVLLTELSTAKIELEAEEQRLITAKINVTRLEDELAVIQNERAALEANIEGLTSQISVIQNSIEFITAGREGVLLDMNACIQQADDAARNIENLKYFISVKTQEIKQVVADLKTLTQERDQLLDQEETAQNLIQTSTLAINQANREITEAETQITNEEKGIVDTSKQINDLQAQAKQLRVELAGIQDIVRQSYVCWFIPWGTTTISREPARQAVRQQIATIEASIAQLNSRQVERRSRIDLLKKAVRDSQARRDTCYAQRATAEGRLTRFRASKREKEATIAAQTNLWKEATSSKSTHEENLSKGMARRAILLSDKNTLQAQLDTLNADQARLTEEKRVLGVTLGEKNDAHELKNSKLTAAQTELTALQADINTRKTNINTKEAELATYRSALTCSMSEMERNQGDLDVKKFALESIESQKALCEVNIAENKRHMEELTGNLGQFAVIRESAPMLRQFIEDLQRRNPQPGLAPAPLAPAPDDKAEAKLEVKAEAKTVGATAAEAS